MTGTLKNVIIQKLYRWNKEAKFLRNTEVDKDQKSRSNGNFFFGNPCKIQCVLNAANNFSAVAQ